MLRNESLIYYDVLYKIEIKFINGIICYLATIPCNATDLCQHICVQRNGTDYCTCRKGYVLESNERNCTGKDSIIYIVLKLVYIYVYMTDFMDR